MYGHYKPISYIIDERPVVNILNEKIILNRDIEKNKSNQQLTTLK